MLAALMERRERMAYDTYVTDCLYIACARLGNKPDKRYYDMINPKPAHKDADEDGRTGMEIAVGRLERNGIKVVD